MSEKIWNRVVSSGVNGRIVGICVEVRLRPSLDGESCIQLQKIRRKVGLYIFIRVKTAYNRLRGKIIAKCIKLGACSVLRYRPMGNRASGVEEWPRLKTAGYQ